MAIIQNIISKLKGEAQPYNWMVGQSESINEMRRRAHFQKLYDFYIGDRKAILGWMQKTMAKQFKPTTIEKMQLPYRNIVKKIIKRTSLAYKYPADRYLVEDQANEAYQEMLENSNINAQSKEWNRLAKLMDTVYVSPTWRVDHIEFDIYPAHLITVKESADNYLMPGSVLYEMDRAGETVKVFWSESEYYEIGKNGSRIESATNGANPYGVLPFIPCRLRATENHWGEGDTQLVDINEQGNIMLASTFHNAIMQSHGIPVGVNLGIPKNETIETTPDKMIKVEGVREGDVVPNLFFAQPTPATSSCLELIDNLFKTAAIDRGLTADSVSLDSTAQSGAAKEIDSWELMELREDDIEALRLFEKQLFQVTAAVWNYHSGKKIAPTATFVIDFSDQKPERGIDEELKEKEFGYAHGLWTPVDDLLDEDEGVDEVKAMQMIEHNLELRKKIQELSGANTGRETDMDNGRDSERELGVNDDTGGEMV